MDPSNSEFYQTHLDRVSRSFAFCIRQLPEPLRGWVGLSYLLCRLVDTIEDSNWPDLKTQQDVFHQFDRCLQNSAECPGLSSWSQVFPQDIVEGEQILIGDAPRLLSDFHALSKPVKEIMRELVLSMSLGMQHFSKNRQDGRLKLNSLAEVNQYCFFVAGLVGELLAKLIANVEPKFDLSQNNLRRAHHFGLFLQKVNLLKDQVADEKVGRHLIPSRELVEDSSQENATEAFDFLLQVPRHQMEFRRFCAWSLFLGLEALKVARKSVLSRQVLKVSRPDMQKLLQRVEEALSDDGALRVLFSELTTHLGWPKRLGQGRAQTSELPQWLTGLYRGLLDTQSLRNLGVCYSVP
jgi:phytoene/squalene synthetase